MSAGKILFKFQLGRLSSLVVLRRIGDFLMDPPLLSKKKKPPKNIKKCDVGQKSRQRGVREREQKNHDSMEWNDK